MIRLLAVLALFFVPAAARAEWYEASTRHFVVYSDENPKKLRAFAERLERFDQAVRILRGISNVPLGDANRLTVYVVGNVTVIESWSAAGTSRASIAGGRAVLSHLSLASRAARASLTLRPKQSCFTNIRTT